MSLHKRRARLVKIDGGRSNRILWVGAIRELAIALKDICPAMRFHHCLQEKLDNLWMKIVTHQHLYCGPNEHHVVARNNLVKIDHTLWKYEPNKVWKNTGESLRHRKAHDSDLGI